MVNPDKELDLDALRPRFSTVVAALGSRITALAAVLRRPTTPPADPALGVEPMMIKPSPHERVAIETHREDRL
jgi:hypothetical protein